MEVGGFCRWALKRPGTSSGPLALRRPGTSRSGFGPRGLLDYSSGITGARPKIRSFTHPSVCPTPPPLLPCNKHRHLRCSILVPLRVYHGIRQWASALWASAVFNSASAIRGLSGIIRGL